MCTLRDSPATFSYVSKIATSLDKKSFILRNLSQENHVKRIASARRKGESPNAVFVLPSNFRKLNSKPNSTIDEHVDYDSHKVPNCETKTQQLSINDKRRNNEGSIVSNSDQKNTNSASSGMFSHFVVQKFKDSLNDSVCHINNSGKSLNNMEIKKESSSVTDLNAIKNVSKTSDKKKFLKKTLKPSDNISKKKDTTNTERVVATNSGNILTTKIPVSSRLKKNLPFKKDSSKLLNKKRVRTALSEDKNQQSILAECDDKKASKKGNVTDLNSFGNPLSTFSVKETTFSYNQNNSSHATSVVISSNIQSKPLECKSMPEDKQITKKEINKLTKDDKTKNSLINLRLKMDRSSQHKKPDEQPPIMTRSSSLNILEEKCTKPLIVAKRSSSKISDYGKSRIPIPSSRTGKMKNKQNTNNGESGRFYEFDTNKPNESTSSSSITKRENESIPVCDSISKDPFSIENTGNRTSCIDDDQNIDKNISKVLERNTECLKNMSYIVGVNSKVKSQVGENAPDAEIMYSEPHVEIDDGKGLVMNFCDSNSPENDLIHQPSSVKSHQLYGQFASQNDLDCTNEITFSGSNTNQETFFDLETLQTENNFSLSKTDFLTKPIEKFMNEIKSSINISDTDEPNIEAEPNKNQKKGAKNKKGRKTRNSGTKKKISRWSCKL